MAERGLGEQLLGKHGSCGAGHVREPRSCVAPVGPRLAKGLLLEAQEAFLEILDQRVIALGLDEGEKSLHVELWVVYALVRRF